jgi:integrase
MFRPFEDIVPFCETGLPPEQQVADQYVWVKGKGGRVRWVPLETPAQLAAVAAARQLVESRDGHMGHPEHDLKRNLRHLDYAMEKFGIAKRAAGVTGHGLRHGRLNDIYEEIAGVPSPVRGGERPEDHADSVARSIVSERAGHARLRAAGAYIGARPPRSPGKQ